MAYPSRTSNSPLCDDRNSNSEPDYPVPSDDGPLYDDLEYSQHSKSSGEGDTPENDPQESDPILDVERNEEGEDNTRELDRDVLSWTFDNIEEDKDFYYAYVNIVGFKVRKQSMKHRTTKIVRYRERVCACEGFKKPSEKCMRQPRPEKRFGCKARFRVAHDPEKQNYKVTNFETVRTHETANLKQNMYVSANDYLK